MTEHTHYTRCNHFGGFWRSFLGSPAAGPKGTTMTPDTLCEHSERTGEMTVPETEVTEVPKPSSKWEEIHEGALAGSETGKCLHCSAARLLGLPKTNEFTPRQKQRMSIGRHFQALEHSRLKEEGADFYPGRQVALHGLAVPVRAQPDFIVRENGRYRVYEVKYRSFPPPEIPREWGYQAGVYSLRYHSCPVTFSVYDFDTREEMHMEGPPTDLPALLHEWCDALRGVLDGKYQPHELPHEPYWCKRSEWACEDCVGMRTADTELSAIEEARFAQYLELRNRFEALKQADKEYDAAKEAAKEMIAARGSIVRAGMLFTVRESRSEWLDMKAIPEDVKATLPTMEVVSRTIVAKEDL